MNESVNPSVKKVGIFCMIYLLNGRDWFMYSFAVVPVETPVRVSRLRFTMVFRSNISPILVNRSLDVNT